MNDQFLFDDLPEEEGQKSSLLDELLNTARMVLDGQSLYLKNEALAAASDFLAARMQKSPNPGPIKVRRIQCLAALETDNESHKNTALTSVIGYLEGCKRRIEAGRLGGQKSAERERDEKGRLTPSSKQTPKHLPKQNSNQTPKHLSKQTAKQNPSEGKGREREGIQKYRGQKIAVLPVPMTDQKPPGRAVADAIASAPQKISIRLPEEQPSLSKTNEDVLSGQEPPLNDSEATKQETQPNGGNSGPKNSISGKRKSAVPEGTKGVCTAWNEAHKAVFGVYPKDGMKSGPEIGAAQNLARDYGVSAGEKLGPAMKRYLKAKADRGQKGSLQKFRMDLPEYLDEGAINNQPKNTGGSPANPSLEEIRADRQRRREEREAARQKAMEGKEGLA